MNRCGARTCGPVELLVFVFCALAGVISVFGDVQVSDAIHRQFPTLEDTYFAVLGLTGLIGAIVGAPWWGDYIPTVRTRLRVEAWMLLALSAEVCGYGVSALSVGATGIFTACLTSGIGWGSLWRVGHIVVDLRDIRRELAKREAKKKGANVA